MLNEIYKENRPYEKCLEHGAVSLTDTELLAVLLRTGVKGLDVLELAKYILGPNCGEQGILNIHNLTLEELKSVKGIGTVKAVQILCLSEFAKRLAKANAKEGLVFSLPSSIA